MENDQTTTQAAPETGQPAVPNFADGLGAVLSNPELMAKLPQMMAMLRPMLEQSNAGTAGSTDSIPETATPASVPASVPAQPAPKKPADQRTALLVALKPFLSEDRRNAVDAMLRISALGDVLRRL